MPKARKRRKQETDLIETAIETAIKAAMISTGEIDDDIDPKSAAAQLGKRGGKARASSLSPERRKEIARKAAIKRWQKRRDQPT